MNRIAVFLGIVAVAFVVALPLAARGQAGGATTLSLRSDFFKDDPVAQSINTGTVVYQMSIANYWAPDWKVDTSSFEWKVLNALRQLGFVRITFIVEPADTPANVVLHKFQRKHNIPISDFLDKISLSLLDAELARREGIDKDLANGYPPFAKFVEAPVNEPSKWHLAALYAKFFGSLPQDMPYRSWTVDEFRNSLVTGLGGNLGKMVSTGNPRVLTVGEMVSVMNGKADFRFCSDVYYDKFRYTDCVNPSPTVFPPSPSSDLEYMTLVAHEYGHGVGRDTQVRDASGTLRADSVFGRISFDMSGVLSGKDWKSEKLLRLSGNDSEFVSGYAKTNNLEDFAESFSAYVHEGNIFRERAKLNLYLRQKYDFLKGDIFHGVEYMTGSVKSFNVWLLKNAGIPFHPEAYDIEDPDWIWDYEYPQKSTFTASRSEIDKRTGEEVITSGPLRITPTPVAQSTINALRARMEELKNRRDWLRSELERIKRERALQPGATIIPSKPLFPAAPFRQQLGDISESLRGILETLGNVTR